MAHSFKLRREVRFCETDMAGIMHFSNYYYFMEEVEHQFMRSLGFSIANDKTFPALGWPRVHTECTYHRPLRFEDQVDIQLFVREKRPRSLRYEIVFVKVSGDRREEVARGGVTVVCTSKAADGSLKAVEIPAAIADRIEVAPESAAAQEQQA